MRLVSENASHEAVSRSNRKVNARSCKRVGRGENSKKSKKGRYQHLEEAHFDTCEFDYSFL